MSAPELAASRAIRRGRNFARALADVEPWLVGPFLALGLMIPRLLGPALAAAALFWLVRWLAWGHLTVATAGDLPIAVLILMLPVTLWVTALPDITQQQVLWLLTGIALYYVIVNWVRSAGRERALVLLLTGAGVVAALIAPVAVTWVTDIKLTIIPEAVYRRLPVLTTSPMHPNVLAGALVLGLPLPLALLLFNGGRMSRQERLASAAAAAGMGLILVLTKSRGALLGAAAAGLALIALRWRRGWMVLVAAAVLAGLASRLSVFAPVAELLSATGSNVGVPGRFEIWSRGLYLVRDFPYTGIGMGTFRQVTNVLYPYFLIGPNADVPHAHNLFLQVAIDLGIPGLIAWLGLLIGAMAAAWGVYRHGRRTGSTWPAGLGAGLLAGQLAMVVHGMLDAAVWGAHSAMVVWVLWGLCMAAYNLRRETRPDPLRIARIPTNAAN